MISLNINVYVTYDKKSILPKARDGSGEKRVISGAIRKVAVIAALQWVGRLLWSLFKGDSEG
jgi:hypothetical protein